MIFAYITKLLLNLGPFTFLFLGIVVTSVIFTVGSIIHNLWSFIRGS